MDQVSRAKKKETVFAAADVTRMLNNITWNTCFVDFVFIRL